MNPKTPADLFAQLLHLGIATRTHEHPAVFTVEQSRPVKAALPGGHTKNLFVKDRRGALFLVCAKDDTPIDLKRLHETIGASGRLSFGSPELLRETLGVEPGSVTPLAIVNDAAGRVTIVLDETLLQQDPVNVHPLVNTMTTAIAAADLLAFLRALGHEPLVRALPAPTAAMPGGERPSGDAPVLTESQDTPKAET